jgi:hypothetical protein
MRAWDLNSGAVRIEEAMKDLNSAKLRIAELWNDKVYHEFQETHLEPLDPLVRRTLEAIRRMAEVLAKAERDCGSY